MQAVILFVEDDRSSRRNISLFLRCSGYEVYEAENAEVAIDLLSSRHFDLIISDFNLPGEINGIEILTAFKTISGSSDGTAILITAYASDEVLSRAQSLGAVYIEKPILLNSLDKAIQQSIARRQAGGRLN
jgi:CheY-like chemotaxis protein